MTRLTTSTILNRLITCGRTKIEQNKVGINLKFAVQAADHNLAAGKNGLGDMLRCALENVNLEPDPLWTVCSSSEKNIALFKNGIGMSLSKLFVILPDPISENRVMGYPTKTEHPCPKRGKGAYWGHK